MRDDITSVENLEWLLELSEQYRLSITAIENSVKLLDKVVPEDYRYFHVRKQNINNLIERSLNEGRVDMEKHTPNSLPEDFKFTKEYWLEYVNEQGDCLRMFDLLKITRAAAVTNLVNDSLELLSKGHVTPAFLCIRSIIEIVASFVHTLGEVTKLKFSANLDEARNVHSSLHELLVQSVFGRRIDWSQILTDAPTSLSSKKSISYKQRDLTVDQLAVGILDQIDFLKKRVKSARKVYELLSEFAHPNTGIFLAHRLASRHRTDRNGQSWEESNIGLQAHPDIFKDMRAVFEQVFITVHDCLRDFERAITADHKALRESIEQNSQLLTRDVVASEVPILDNMTKISELLDPYSWCPCASSAKFKFCCGAKKKEKH